MTNENGHPILSVFSVKDISAVFSDIDEKIISLHKCSSDDFLMLNENFRKYYKDAKAISENATKVFDIISDKENSKHIISELDNYYDQLYNYNQQFSEIIVQFKRFFEDVLKKLDLLFIPTNNFNQNIMTLKLLRTNLKLEPGYNNRNEHLRSKLDTHFQQIKDSYNIFALSLKSVRKLLEKAIEKLNFIEDFYLAKTKDILVQIKNSKELLSEKNKEAIEKLPNLTTKINDNSQNIAKIITNLQYHDIIRQKIEHVQQVHKEILDDLKNIEHTDEVQDDEDRKIDFFFKIRDIARLQASQLLHANKEYQNAIEVITQKMLDLGNNMSAIAEMGNRISIQSGKEQKNNHFGEIGLRLSNVAHLKAQLLEANEEINKQYKLINKDLKLLFQNFNQIRKRFDHLENLLFEIDNQEEIVTNEASTQIKELLEDIRANKSRLTGLLEEIYYANDDLKKDFERSYADEKMADKVQALKDNAHNILGALNKSRDQLQDILKSNSEMSIFVSDQIKTSVEQVKYYDYFDKMIEEIISELNDISAKLYEGDTGEQKYDVDTLKQRYTMKSEHVIHDNISKDEQKGEVDLFNNEAFDVNQEEEDDDNLELF